MKKNIFYILWGFILMVSCKDEPKTLSDLKSNFYEIQHNGLRLGDSLNIYFFEHEELVKSVEISWNGKAFENHTVMDSINTKLGINELKIKVNLEGNSILGETKVPILNSFKETPVEFEVVKEYPHPKELFTQGFFISDGKIYESSGRYGHSKLVTYKPGSVNYSEEIKQDPTIFSEGIAWLNDKIYQLTYKERKVLAYDAKTLKLESEIPYPAFLKEGWGMTTNGKELMVSDGSQNIYFFDSDFNLQRKIQVAGYQSVYTYLNEMEFINGKIFANVWTTNFILIINPESGAVEQYYDLTSLSETKGSDDVLNGIALFNNRLLVTGKNWEKIYELPLPN
ncbi:MAG TPA: glutaminyl-peptide cyclotransferase [Moheibacter sp.]|nr:glutaminyl-peptide cyclotransferase [Moheibacter sp.]